MFVTGSGENRMLLARHRVGLCAAAIAIAAPAYPATNADKSADMAAAAGADADATPHADAKPRGTDSSVTKSDSSAAKPAGSGQVTLEEIVVASNRYEATDI